MSVQWTVARAVGFGIVKDHLPFVRTAKGGVRKSKDFHAFWEAILASLLILGAFVVYFSNTKEIREIDIFALVLIVQSLPFIAAVAIALVERSRLNEFAYWQGVEARAGELVPLLRRTAPVAEVARPLPPIPPQNPGELVQ